MNIPWYRFILALFITALLFVTAFLLSGKFTNTKIDEIWAIQDKISTDILSTETRFVLLGSSSCDHISSSEDFEVGLTNELSDMARRVKFMENQLGYEDHRVSLIKDQYALLQIKDYLIRKQLSERCNEELPTVLYFHGVDCDECQEQSVVLDEIHEKYPSVRIYWLDKDKNTPALDTLISMFSIETVPALVVGEDKHENLQSLSALIDILSEKYSNIEPLETKESVSNTQSEESL